MMKRVWRWLGSANGWMCVTLLAGSVTTGSALPLLWPDSWPTWLGWVTCLGLGWMVVGPVSGHVGRVRAAELERRAEAAKSQADMRRWLDSL